LKIAVYKETRHNDQRVGLTPEVAKRLISSGHTIRIESGAGVGAGFRDEDYSSVGAQICATTDELCRNADVVVWIKRPDGDANIDKIPETALVIGFFDPHKPGNNLKPYRDAGFSCLSLEMLERNKETEGMDALTAMGKIAGEVAYREAAEALEQKSEYVLILGAGNAGLAAAKAAQADGLIPLVCSTSGKYRVVDSGAKFIFISDESRQQAIIAETVMKYKPSIIIATARKRGQDKAPVLLGNSLIEEINWPVIVQDLTASIGGNTPHTKADETIKANDYVTISNRTNYPSTEPGVASAAYAGCMEHLINRLASQGRSHDPLLAKAMIIIAGKPVKGGGVSKLYKHPSP
jgi:NAD(P) transhydrogenase subunit alpha